MNEIIKKLIEKEKKLSQYDDQTFLFEDDKSEVDTLIQEIRELIRQL